MGSLVKGLLKRKEDEKQKDKKKDKEENKKEKHKKKKNNKNKSKKKEKVTKEKEATETKARAILRRLSSKRLSEDVERVRGEEEDQHGVRQGEDRKGGEKQGKEEEEEDVGEFDREGQEEEDDDEEEEEEEGGEEDEEEGEEGDEFVGTLDFMDHSTQKKDSDFQCLSPEEIIARQEQEILEVSELFSLSLSTAAALLRHFQWKREKLIEKYMEDPDSVCRDAGVKLDKSSEGETERESGGAFVTTTTTTTATTTAVSEGRGEELECSICADEVSAEECTALKCRHNFCNECWKQYLTLKIKEGEVSRIKCPEIKCNLIVDEWTIRSLVEKEIYEKFVRFVTQSFVDNSDGRVKWCPRPNCGNAITADMITGTVVKCTCGYRFCFQCHREAHAPSTCEQVKKWLQKCKDDSETTHWKYANTKDCPKCETSTEKNGGCNHMTCRQCKHEWCWVCLRPWKGHNDYYNCNKFLKPEKKKTSFFFRKGKKEKAKEREAQREKNRLALERYLHFFERYSNHSHSSELEKQIRSRATSQVNELQQEAITSSELQYILEGTEELLEARNVLKYTYVFAYYLPEAGPEKELFEYLQEDLEKTTEQLSEILESPASNQVHRLKAVNIIQLTKTRKGNLLNAVEQGLTSEEHVGEYAATEQM